MSHKRLVLAFVTSLAATASVPAEVIFSDAFDYDLPEMSTLTGDTAEGRAGVPWKAAVEGAAARITLVEAEKNKSLLLRDTRLKPREEVYTFLERLTLQPGTTLYYGATITPRKANDNPESGRFLSFSTSDKRGEGVTRARLSMWMKGDQLALGLDSDGVAVEADRTFPFNEPIRVVVAYTFGGDSRLWAGGAGKLSEEADVIAESKGHRKDPFTCFWIGIPSNSDLELDDLVIATTWAEASQPPR